MENTTLIQILGIVSVLIIQIGQTARTWLTNRKINKNVVDRDEKLNKKVDILQEQIEHISFIPAFEIEIDLYINDVIKGFTFKLKNIKSLTLTTVIESKKIFINVLKVGFHRFDNTALKSSFDMQHMKLYGMFDSLDLNINKAKFFKIIKLEKEAYNIKLNQVIDEESNGKRQQAFKELCENYIFNIIKQISTLEQWKTTQK